MSISDVSLSGLEFSSVLIVSMEEGEFLLSLNLLDNKEHIV
jgi:hypothetical protein